MNGAREILLAVCMAADPERAVGELPDGEIDVLAGALAELPASGFAGVVRAIVTAELARRWRQARRRSNYWSESTPNR